MWWRRKRDVLLVPHRAGVLAFVGAAVKLSPEAAQLLRRLAREPGAPVEWYCNAHYIAELRKLLGRDAIKTHSWTRGRYSLSLHVNVEDFHAAGAAEPEAPSTS